MSEQPKALRLADEPFWTDDDCASAAAELRRLHALCEEMGEPRAVGWFIGENKS